MSFFVCLLVIACFQGLGATWADCTTSTCQGSDTPWYYVGIYGPSCWPLCFPACGGTVQSPIDLQTPAAPSYAPGSDLTFTGHDSAQTITFTNNGHAAEGDLSVHTAVSGLGLPGTYKGQQFHFHWGSVSTQGSEHTVNGKSYPLELHFVHYSANYADFATAASQPNGLAVLSWLFEISSSDNANFQEIIAALAEIKYKDDETTFSMSINQLFGKMSPADFGNYARYSGSLTTPPCSETVVWTVFTDPLPISENQMAAFRELMAAHHHRLEDNNRPVQALNGHVVNFGKTGDDSHGGHHGGGRGGHGGHGGGRGGHGGHGGGRGGHGGYGGGRGGHGGHVGGRGGHGGYGGGRGGHGGHGGH